MSNIESIITLEHHKKRYTVAYINQSGTKIPIVLDRDVYKVIRKLDKRWYINNKNHIYCLHSKDSNTYPVYLHEIVVKLSKNNDYDNMSNVPIIHINNIHFDNRIENLQFDTPDKDCAKNTKKKRRIIDLAHHGINVDNLPTYLWYLKPDKSHGDRFIIEMPNILTWRSTASKKVSLRYKLEEAKKYLRFMKSVNPEIFEACSMNGDLTCIGLKLYKEYQSMIAKAGFEMDDPSEHNTDIFLASDTSDLNDFEIYLLDSFNPKNGATDISAAYVDYQILMGIE